MNYEHKWEKISELRKKLEDLIEISFNLTDPEVVKFSKQLDILICECQFSQLSSKNKSPGNKR